MRVLVVDNYDSFTFNLVQYLGELGADVVVARNDQISVAEVVTDPPDRLVISPCPGRPEDAGVSVALVRELDTTVPILGVCLGHQAVVVAYGGEIGHAPEPRHGKTSMIRHDGRGVFTGIANPFVATRYHSLAAVDVPSTLEVCAWSEDDVVQGVRHRTLPVYGVQFHPESVMTEEGKTLLSNFLTG